MRSSKADGQSSEMEALVPHSDIQKLRRGKEALGEMFRFGPTYGEQDPDLHRRAKALAWERVMEEEPFADNGARNPYDASIADVEEAALVSYEDVEGGPKFRKMMVRDGCFFLQLALHILGAGELLGYSDLNPYFGKNVVSTSRIPDMFLPGNQIPYAVITALMKQYFFRKVIERGNWQRPSEDDIVRLALYQTVVEPQLDKKVARDKRNPPSDILAALHKLLLGFAYNPDPIDYEMRNLERLETGSTEEIPSAGMLGALGIKIVKGKAGIANIRFKNFGYSARLYLPPINFHTASVLASLANYEERLHFDKSQREVAAYLRFIRDLIPTYKDFKILESSGVILLKGEDSRGEDLGATFNHTLNDIVSYHNPTFTAKYIDMKRKIAEYEVVPWRFMSLVCSFACGIMTFILAVLTILQTVIAVLSYIHDRRT